MAEPPASGCAMRGEAFGMSVEGLSELLLLIGELGELGFCAFAGAAHTPNRSEAATHKEKSAGC
jgi:hypothetical protein